MSKALRVLQSFAIALCAASAFAQTADWPVAGKPIQLTVPSPGGGGTGPTGGRGSPAAPAVLADALDALRRVGRAGAGASPV